MKWLLILPVFLTGCISGTMDVGADGSCHAEFTSVLKSVEAISFCGFDAINSRNNDHVIDQIIKALK